MKAFLTERFRAPEQKKLPPMKDPVLAKLCVGYLAAGIPWNPSSAADPRLQAHPLLTYALFNLARHFEPNDSSFTSAQLMLDFYRPTNLFWTRWRDEYESQISKRDRLTAPNIRPGERCSYTASQGLDFVLEQLIADDATVVNMVGGTYGTPLQVACFKGLASTVTILLRHGAAVSLRAGIYTTALHAAVAADVLAIVEALLAHGAKATAVNASGRTALLEAIWYEHWSIVPFLISATEQVDLACTFGNMPLSTAAQKGHLETIESLVKKGAALNPDRGLVNPLLAACRHGKVSAAALLLRSGADGNVLDPRDRTPLIVSAELGNHELTQLLLDAGVDPDCRDSLGWSALHHSAAAGQWRPVKSLLAAGANHSLRDLSGRSRTAMHMAVTRGHFKTVQAMLSFDLNIEDTSLIFELVRTSKVKNFATFSQELLDTELSKDRRRTLSDMLLSCVVRLEDVAAVKLLFEGGASIGQANATRQTPLFLATANRNDTTVEILLGAGADPHIIDWTGEMALANAARVGSLKATGSPITYATPIDDAIKQGPITAAEGGYFDLTKLFLGSGANSQTRGYDERAVILMTVTSHHSEKDVRTLDDQLLAVEDLVAEYDRLLTHHWRPGPVQREKADRSWRI
jgi:ankyrin repeat protein